MFVFLLSEKILITSFAFIWLYSILCFITSVKPFKDYSLLNDMYEENEIYDAQKSKIKMQYTILLVKEVEVSREGQ